MEAKLAEELERRVAEKELVVEEVPPGFGRRVVSETEVPSMFANLVRSG